MVKTKKSVQKEPESSKDTEDNTSSELAANASLTDATSSDHGDGPEEVVPTSSILEAIRQMETSLNVRFDKLDTTLTEVKNAVASNTSRITELEERLGESDGRLADLEKGYEEMRTQNILLKTKVIDLESRSRRQNIKIIGLPEKIEKGSPSTFVSDFLLKLLGAEQFPRGIKVDRAHRSGAPGNRPRVMIAKIHHDSMKEKIIRMARNEGPLTFEGQRISIFPDLTAEVMKDRRDFDPVRLKLKEANVRHGFLFPARLIFTHADQTKIFVSPKEAAAYVDKHIKPPSSGNTE